MLAHDWLDGFGRFVSVIEWDGGHIVMEDVSFDYAMEQMSADETEFAVNRRRGPTSKIPGLGFIMG